MHFDSRNGPNHVPPNMADLASLRKDYTLAGLSERDLAPDPWGLLFISRVVGPSYIWKPVQGMSTIHTVKSSP